MKVYLHTIGCRLNQSEIETMARQLLAAGHEIVGDTAVADKVIVNTCAVTSQAARDARTLTRRIHRQNADAEILLTGCYAAIAPDELAKVEGAGRIVSNEEKDGIVQLIDPQARIKPPIFDQEPIMREFLAGTAVFGQVGNTRAFVKVQDGCNNKCTFCITTVARGAGQSRRLGDLVAEIQALTAAGYQEAVLTGVHLGSYGRDLDDKNGLRELIAAILRHTDIPRLRISSLEPWEIAPDFFELWANRRLLPHLHMPLQSGSDKILRRMARRTSRVSFRALATVARAAIPNLHLSSDMIVGFPGETEADFAASMEYAAEMAFGRMHVFSYSQRPGTAASTMPDQINGRVKKERAHQLIELGRELSLKFHKQYEGKIVNALWENNAAGLDGKWVGYTDNYIRVQTTALRNLFNRVMPITITAVRPDGVSGTIVERDQNRNE